MKTINVCIVALILIIAYFYTNRQHQRTYTDFSKIEKKLDLLKKDLTHAEFLYMDSNVIELLYQLYDLRAIYENSYDEIVNDCGKFLYYVKQCEYPNANLDHGLDILIDLKDKIFKEADVFIIKHYHSTQNERVHKIIDNLVYALNAHIEMIRRHIVKHCSEGMLNHMHAHHLDHIRPLDTRKYNYCGFV